MILEAIKTLNTKMQNKKQYDDMSPILFEDRWRAYAFIKWFNDCIERYGEVSKRTLYQIFHIGYTWIDLATLDRTFYDESLDPTSAEVLYFDRKMQCYAVKLPMMKGERKNLPVKYVWKGERGS